jgi:hypothetical protein
VLFVQPPFTNVQPSLHLLLVHPLFDPSLHDLFVVFEHPELLQLEFAWPLREALIASLRFRMTKSVSNEDEAV